MTPLIPSSRWCKTSPKVWLAPLKIAAAYAVVAGLWIILSDRVLFWFIGSAAELSWLQTVKGGFFVVATALLLAWLVRRYTLALHEEARNCEKVQERFRALVETIPHGIQECDTRGVISFTNPAYDRIFGLDPGEAIGTTIWDKYADEDERHSLEEYILELAETQPEPSPYVTRNLVKGGGSVDIQVDWNYLRDGRGRLTGFASIVTDVTERRKAEEAIRANDRLKSELITTAAHEFRTPLTTIQGFAELMTDNPDLGYAERGEYLGYIQRKCYDLSEMVDNLLDLSRIEAGRQLPLKIVPCAVGNLLQEVEPLLKKISTGHLVGVALEQDESQVLADPGRIGQVFDNLLSNAAKYSRQGSTIAVQGELCGEHYRFTVKDQGIGLSEEQRERMFERFYRVDSSDSSPSGFGIGMAIVKEIIEAHQGRIEVESTLGEGTTVSFELRLAG
mgnify:CR=1 FL=1